MIRFILNNTLIRTDKPAGLPLLDFIRREVGLTGTKTGCREGDCGACMVLSGEWNGSRLEYKTAVSCLTPLGNVHGRHIVTIEGICVDGLSPVQEAILEHTATQCGFCTPGFVISLTAHSLSDDAGDAGKALSGLDGNLCRCTGYKSLERAVDTICGINRRRRNEDAVAWMVGNGYLPAYFLTIPGRLSAIEQEEPAGTGFHRLIAGGTDLMVQQADELRNDRLTLMAGRADLKQVIVADGICHLGASVTASDIMNSGALRSAIPKLEDHFRLIASSPVRNAGTIAGNIVNASPIADLVILFLVLDAGIQLSGPGGRERTVAMKDFFTGYKRLDMKADEHIRSVYFRLPAPSDLFNFEKVSKRQHLDIASVNSAALIRMDGRRIREIRLSAGGVSPVPLCLTATSGFLTGQPVDRDVLIRANQVMQKEISPISDIRGSDRYKRLLLRQLFYAHFIELFPGEIDLNLIHSKSA